MGDFVKGPISGLNFSPEVLTGIQLHRAVDTFTDQHPFTLGLKQELGSYRRYGGIVLDVFFDHQLANQFQQIASMPLSQFSQMSYEALSALPDNAPARYIRVVNAMQNHDWLSGYQDLNNIERALNGIDSRLKKPVQLSQTLDWYEPRQNRIKIGFIPFYEELIHFSLNFLQKL